MTSCTGSVRGGFWRFEKKQLVEFLPLNSRVEFLPRKKTVDFRSSPRPRCGCTHGGGGCRWKSQHIKIVSLSSSCRKTF